MFYRKVLLPVLLIMLAGMFSATPSWAGPGGRASESKGGPREAVLTEEEVEECVEDPSKIDGYFTNRAHWHRASSLRAILERIVETEGEDSPKIDEILESQLGRDRSEGGTDRNSFADAMQGSGITNLVFTRMQAIGLPPSFLASFQQTTGAATLSAPPPGADVIAPLDTSGGEGTPPGTEEAPGTGTPAQPPVGQPYGGQII